MLELNKAFLSTTTVNGITFTMACMDFQVLTVIVRVVVREKRVIPLVVFWRANGLVGRNGFHVLRAVTVELERDFDNVETQRI